MQHPTPRDAMPPLAQAFLGQDLAGEPVLAALGHLAWHPECRFSEIAQGTERVVVAGVARYGTFLRFGPTDRALAEALVTQGDYPGVLGRMWEEAGCLVSPAQVASLAERLLTSGLVYDRRSAPTAPRPARTWRDAVQWKLPLWDPTPLLDRLGPLSRAVATRRFLLLVWLPVFVTASALTVSRLGEITGVATRLFGLQEPHALAWLYGLLFLVLAFHEFGHAAVCHALGAPVRRIGVMAYLGMPFGYCDVSGAHLLARRRDRIAVSLGGLYYQTGLGALAVIAWAWLPMGEPARDVALRLAIVAGATIVFDLNPFAKLDGYYVLSDWLGIPNLRDRSFAYLRARLTGRAAEPLSIGLRRLFLAYAVLGALATVAVLALGVLWWGRLLGIPFPF